MDFADRREPLAPFYPASAYSTAWMSAPRVLSGAHRDALCTLLEEGNRAAGAGNATFENLARLRQGAGAVVTGQQVTLFGGPLLTLLKAATAIRKAQDATLAGHPHVPIFWLASEDHDLAEADHIVLPSGSPSGFDLRTLRVVSEGARGAAVGSATLGAAIREVLEQAAELLGEGASSARLTACYRPDATFAQAFAAWLAAVFAEQGLIVIDASSRGFHALGRSTLLAALTQADEFHAALEDRNNALQQAGYHAQVLTPPQSSLLFLIDSASGSRLSLKRMGDGAWQAGRQSYSTAELTAILEAEPERISPNALLRPVFQDTLLPTSLYIGGPAEIAYFAQSQALYERILGRATSIQPRLSATLIEPEIAALLTEHGLELPQIIESGLEDPQALAQRLGARAMPVETKQRLAAAGNALDVELASLTAYLHTLNDSLGRASDVAASKMLYQMNRLRRLAANFELNRSQHLLRDAQTLQTHLFPERQPQERILGAEWFLSRCESLPALLVEQAGQQCPGHKAIWL